MRPHPEPTPCSDHSRRPSDQLPPSPQEYGLAEASTAGNGLIGGLSKGLVVQQKLSGLNLTYQAATSYNAFACQLPERAFHTRCRPSSSLVSEHSMAVSSPPVVPLLSSSSVSRNPAP